MIGCLHTKFFSKCGFISKFEKWLYVEKPMFFTKGNCIMDIEILSSFKKGSNLESIHVCFQTESVVFLNHVFPKQNTFS